MLLLWKSKLCFVVVITYPSFFILIIIGYGIAFVDNILTTGRALSGLLPYKFLRYNTCVYVTGFGKTDHIVTIDISRNTNLKYRSRHGSLVLDCSHARFAV